ncbi:hypothetical protein M433DRAFT_150055 [Acidomyces richmondensis BFW]|nr:MAG: hypothetical protein FE78DRAFT_88363 [Acidomyces sp. 'richmondensis']KYG49381.1 hypothetical protein M433DRAFT_150055 [Acidomyces richmondensis BFW]
MHLFVADIVLSALFPVSFFLPDLCYDVCSRIAESVWRGIQRIFTGTNGAQITVSGLKSVPSRESAIVVSNHIEWTDFYLLQELAERSGMLGRCRWFAKQELKWVPFLGWGLWAMGMPLVSRKWTHDQKEMDRVFDGLLKRRWPMWLIAYSEGTRFTPLKRLEAEAYCRMHNKRLGQHLLYPRTKGFVASVQKLRHAPQMKAVYDVTLAYAKDKHFQSPPTFVQTVSLPRLGDQWKFFVHVERYSLESLPKTDAELMQWLEDRWIEKGERLEKLNQRLIDGIPWESIN